MSADTRGDGNSRTVSASLSPKSTSPSDCGPRSCLKLQVAAGSGRENDDPILRLARKSRGLNCTYVISACKMPGGTPLTPNPLGGLTLQRRVARSKESPLLGSAAGESPGKGTETRLTLRRCARPGSTNRRAETRDVGAAPPGPRAGAEAAGGCETSLATASRPSAAGTEDTELTADERNREASSVPGGPGGSVAGRPVSHSTPVSAQSQPEAVPSGRRATGPTQSQLDVRGSGPGNWPPRSMGKDTAKNSSKFGSLERRTPTKRIAEPRVAPLGGSMGLRSPAAPTAPRSASRSWVPPRPSSGRERPQEHTLPPQEEAAAQHPSAERDPLKAESSRVTVAVRVRPFSTREKAEDAAQVVFLSGEAVTVRHPDMKHVYSFTYDVALWSVDESHPHYASQAAVYEALAAPLLARALEGYNACVFAYGQTGSGKSYTMMGFGEEPGIIPRFCEDLFAQVAKRQAPEVSYHLELSFFEVYNEKIHDLLVSKGESGQRKQPLRVREHPVSGPYVEALAVNAVSSYSDVQGWLELGGKQRATAATGVNDKSSRSHAVLTLLVTRTQTERVDGEAHEHRTTSRVSLVDLAGSERCGPAGTCGQQLREGVSINKSLLTLGKVISALAELGGRRGAFVPYRESVLTWLLRESLGGNSKTAMVATVSPAAGSVEETLGTLRYALQARSIVNVARVNEDASAQLVRELKAEIEKLKAAQRGRPNIDPERYRLCRQEITSLRMKLHQQERDMAEMQRVWKEKFEEAERRKHQEIKELQEAGIAFHPDTHSPSLVNLSADPQLSERLLYVIRDGATTVGRRGCSPSPAIQLSGVLVAEDHCTIRNVGGAVSITPSGEARTYVNGKHILEPTELHHGDRVVLGGDHYFRFNHPREAQSGKCPSKGDTPAGEGPKDFEFAKNELLSAQRSQLAAEVQAAQLGAKREQLHSVQVAAELARQELSAQRAAYEDRISALEAQLEEESQRKKMQEISSQKAAHRIEELEKAKQRLEQEVHANRKRLELESLAAKQALEDHSVRHTRVLEALEAEKRTLAEEVQALQRRCRHRAGAPAAATSWGALRLSVMLQEANFISARAHRQYVFGRHEVSQGGCSAGVRVQNLQLGVFTVWSLEKFESKLASMKELYEGNRGSQCDDLFCDPDDEWQPDLTGVPVTSVSKRRSRSLARSRRVSGYLRDVPAPVARNAASSRSTGLMETPGSTLSSPADPLLPGICKDVIAASLAALGQGQEDRTAADGLVDALLEVHGGLLALARAHADQDEDSQEDLFAADRAAQAQAVRVACAFGRLVVLVTHWPGDVPPDPSTAGLGDELREEVRKLGSYLQVFLQGCCSDLSSVVTDAQRRAVRVVQQAVRHAAQVAALSGTGLRLLDGGGPGAQEDVLAAAWDGVGAGVRLLLDAGREQVRGLELELRRERPRLEGPRQMSARAVAFLGALESVLAECRPESSRIQAQEESSGHGDLKTMVDCASDLLQLKHCLEQTIQMVASALRGCSGDAALLSTCLESVCRAAGAVHAAWAAGGDLGLGDLESAAKSLLLCFEPEGTPELLEPQGAGRQRNGEGPRPSRPGGGQGVPRRVYALPSGALRSPRGCPPARTQWV